MAYEGTPNRKPHEYLEKFADKRPKSCQVMWWGMQIMTPRLHRTKIMRTRSGHTKNFQILSLMKKKKKKKKKKKNEKNRTLTSDGEKVAGKKN